MSKIKRALDVVKDLRSLADSIEYLVEALEGNEVVSSNNAEASSSKEAPESTQPAETKESQVDKQPEVKEEKQPTLEEVRAAMAEKNREGHREKVKAIIHKYGANKLTALDPKHYAQVLKEVGEIK